MFSKSKKESRSDSEQREQYEYARKRIDKKKGVLQHLTLFLAGSITILVMSLFFGYGNDLFFANWHIWVLLIWGFVFLLHFFNVFVKNKFMDKEWEDRQLEKLKAKQEKRIKELEENAKDELFIESETLEENNPESSEEL